ncbi:MAG TPA: helix-turn-helix domain-containing protein [Nitrolancea sp.]|nr:helix-turn-helix domain-containing protein [Nitrolancea sp.]
MSTTLLEREPVLAREEERPTLKRIAEGFQAGQVAEEGKVRVTFGAESVELPESLVRLIQQVVNVLVQGEAVSIVPYHKDLTTQEAADILNVSRQYLVRLLEKDEMPYHMTGTHRRIRFGDLMEYKRRRDATRRRGLAKLTQQSQKLGLYQ